MNIQGMEDCKSDMEEIKNAILVFCKDCNPDVTPEKADFGFFEVFYCPHINVLKRKYDPKWVTVSKAETKNQANSLKA